MTAGETLSLVMIGGAAVVALFRKGASRQIALAMIGGVVVNRLVILGIPDFRAVGGAAILVTIGAAAFKRDLIVVALLLILSGLCHSGQQALALPPELGNPFLMTSEILWWAALLGVYVGGSTRVFSGDAFRQNITTLGLYRSVVLGYSAGRGDVLSSSRASLFGPRARASAEKAGQ